MLSRDYRVIISKISRTILKKKFPGLNKIVLNEATVEIAKVVHARFYGATVDNVASPIWRDHDTFKKDIGDMQPTKTAQEILDEC